MHQALYISEVLAEIVRSLKNDDCAGSLVNFATTCRLFFLPAVSHVWAEADFVDFIQILASNLLTEEGYLADSEFSETERIMASSFS